MTLNSDNIYFLSEDSDLESHAQTLLLHTGSIDRQIVLMLSKQLEAKLKEIEINTKMVKRVHFICVEIIQNVSKYSNDNIKGKGAVSVKKKDNVYYISSVNIVFNYHIEDLKKTIAHLNMLTDSELDELYDKTLLTIDLNTRGSANLGFIEMIRKSEQQIRYSFEKINEEISNFYITITIENKNMKEKLVIEQGEDTPKIVFDNESGIFEFFGKSFPDNVIEFYSPVLEWIRSYAENPKETTHVVISLDYFNTSSAKILLDILQLFSALNKKGFNVNVKWLHDPEDEDIQQAGLRYSRVANIPIEVTPKKI